jgi:hypothetical protein
VASKAAKIVEDLISLHRVVRPPSARITTNAAKASACARSALSNEIPMPDSPITMPSPKNNSRDGRPIRAPIRAAIIAAIKTTAPTRRMTSISIMRTSFPRLTFLRIKPRMPVKLAEPAGVSEHVRRNGSDSERLSACLRAQLT